MPVHKGCGHPTEVIVDKIILTAACCRIDQQQARLICPEDQVPVAVKPPFQSFAHYHLLDIGITGKSSNGSGWAHFPNAVLPGADPAPIGAVEEKALDTGFPWNGKGSLIFQGFWIYPADAIASKGPYAATTIADQFRKMSDGLLLQYESWKRISDKVIAVIAGNVVEASRSSGVGVVMLIEPEARILETTECRRSVAAGIESIDLMGNAVEAADAGGCLDPEVIVLVGRDGFDLIGRDGAFVTRIGKEVGETEAVEPVEAVIRADPDDAAGVLGYAGCFIAG